MSCMVFNNVSILGLSHVEANHIIKSEDIENTLAANIQKFGMKPHVIQDLTGIKERRFWDPGVEPSAVATIAAEKALERAGVQRSQVGALISTSVCKDFVEPSVAALVHGNLKLSSECINFDLSSACLAFLNGMDVAAMMLEAKRIDYALVVNGESVRELIGRAMELLSDPQCDEKMFKENFATLTLGSGATAMVLTRSEHAPQSHKFLGGVTLAATEHNRLCCWKGDRMITDGSKLLSEGIRLAIKTYEKAKIMLDWKNKKIDEYIFHQVGLAHTAKLSEHMHVDLSKSYMTFPRFGNMGPASLPFTLAKGDAEGRFTKGQRIALLGIGSGLNCAMMEVIW